MSRTTITLELNPAHESLLPDYAAFLAEMKQLAATVPDGAVLGTCEKAVLQEGREHQRRVLEEAVQSRVQDAEKKGRL